MSRSFASASSQFMEHAATPITGVPLTISAWFYAASTGTLTLFSITNSANTDNLFSLTAAGGTQIRARSQSASGGSGAVSSTGYSVNTWTHACGVISAVNARAAFTNGGGKGTTTASITPTGLDQMTVGALGGSSRSFYWNGRLANVVLRNVALTDAEVAAEATGIDPFHIRPDTIVGYWPCWGQHSPEIDLSPGNRVMTVTGATVATHAPVQPFSALAWSALPFAEEAAAGGGVPRQMMHYKRLRAA